MMSSNPKLTCLFFAVAAIAMSGNPVCFADGVSGFVRIPCEAGDEWTDTVLSAPLRENASLCASVDTVSASSGEADIAVAGASFSVDQFVVGQPHFLRFTSGGEEGRAFEVTGNTADTVTIDTGNETLSSVASADLFKLIPYWTLETLFPAWQGTIHESAGVLPVQRGTEILFFDTTSEGINLSPDRVYFRTSEGWKQAGQGYPDAGEIPIEPGAVFVVRHPPGVSDTVFISYSFVEKEGVGVGVKSVLGSPQDSVVALERPIPVILSNLDLEGVFEESPSNADADRADQLLVFDRESGTINSLPNRTYFLTASGWREDTGNNTAAADNSIIPEGSVLVIRKAPGTSTATQVWLNLPRF